MAANGRKSHERDFPHKGKAGPTQERCPMQGRRPAHLPKRLSGPIAYWLARAGNLGNKRDLTER